MKTHILERTCADPLVFRGAVISEAVTRAADLYPDRPEVQDLVVTVRTYRCEDGRFAVEHVRTGLGAPAYRHAALCASLDELRFFLQGGPGAAG